MEQHIQYLMQQKRIKSVIDIAQFVSPVGEVVDDINDNPVDSLAENYRLGGVQWDHGTDEEDMAIPPIREEKALGLLSRLRMYEEQQEDGDVELRSRLNKYGGDIEARATEQREDPFQSACVAGTTTFAINSMSFGVLNV